MEYKVQAYCSGNGENNKLFSFKVKDITEILNPLEWMREQGLYIKAAYYNCETVDQETGEIKVQTNRFNKVIVDNYNGKVKLTLSKIDSLIKNSRK